MAVGPGWSVTERFFNAVLEALFLDEEPRDWRLRGELRITPVTVDSYRERVRYQFRLSRRLIEAAMTRAGGALDPGASEVEVVMPIDYLPKQLLLDATVKDSDGKDTHVLHSTETTARMTSIFRAAMRAIDERVGTADRPDVARRFLEQSERIVTCLIGSGQGEIARRLEIARRFPPDHPRPRDFVRGMLDYLGEALQQFTGQRTPSPALRFACEVAAESALGVLERRPLAALDGNEFHSPILNPLLLVTDYLKKHFVSAKPEASIDQFLLDCRIFHRNLLPLLEDPLWPYIGVVLFQMTYYYTAMARMTVPLGGDFTVELEQIIPLGDPVPWRWRDRAAQTWRNLRYAGYQWYPLRLGDYRSVHVEVISETPAELEQLPRKALVDAGGTLVPASVVFGRASHEASDYSHFYTNKTAQELSMTSKALGLGLDANVVMHDLKLGIKYRIEAATRWGYRLITMVVVFASLYLLSVYDPEVRGRGSFLPVVPLLFTLLGALASFRPQETIVATRMRKYKAAVLMMSFAMATYFIVGVLHPPLVSGFRRVLQQVGLGALLTSPDAQGAQLSVRACAPCRTSPLPSPRPAGPARAS